MSENNIFENAGEKLLHSWEVHRQAFGPILEPAFQENKEARIHLLAALNLLSRKEAEKSREKLILLKEYCNYDEDKAAYNFFMGLSFDIMGLKDQMVKWYEKANEYEHNFYLPYLKLAKVYHTEAFFDSAERNYLKAIKCLEVRNEYFDAHILSSALTNLTSCLTMMHKLSLAEKTLEKAESTLVIKGQCATASILYAAMGKKEISENYLLKAKEESNSLYMLTKKMTEDIQNKIHPHFSPCSVSEIHIEKFWLEFYNKKEDIKKLDKEAFDFIKIKLKEIFPFIERDMRMIVTKTKEGKMKIAFSDFYTVSLNFGLKMLLGLCPDKVLDEFEFDIKR